MYCVVITAFKKHGCGVNPMRYTNWFLLSVSSVSIGDILSSDSSHYLVLEMMGTGGCGQIFKCRNMNTNDLVVLKLPTTHTAIFGTKEEVHVCNTFSAFVSSL